MANTKTKTDKKAVKLPSKATMNFARRESSFNVKKMAIILIPLILAIALVAKFGILDQVEKKTQAYSVLSEKQAKLAECSEKLAGYNDLYNKYGRYSYGWMTESEVNTVDRMQILELIEKKIMPMASVEDFAINNNVLTLNLSGINLEQTSTMVRILEDDELVQSATLYSASAQEADEAEVFMSVILTNQEKEG